MTFIEYKYPRSPPSPYESYIYEISSLPVLLGLNKENCVCQDVDSKQSDQVTRFIKKIEKSDEYLDSVLNFSTLSEEKVMQNVALEIYEDYFDKVRRLARFFIVKRFF